jgi:Tfp pilus assembly protein PilF
MTNQLRFGLILGLTLAVWTNSARALDDSDKEAIRSLSNQAATDYDQHRYEAARDKFLRAYRLAQVPRLAVWVARANEKLGHLVTAYELYRQALSLQPNDLWKADTQQQAQKDAEAELSQLQPRIPNAYYHC